MTLLLNELNYFKCYCYFQSRPWNVDTIAHETFSKSRVNSAEHCERMKRLTEEESSGYRFVEKKIFFQTNILFLNNFYFSKSFTIATSL